MPHSTTNTKNKNAVAIFIFKNPYWVWFLVDKSVATLLSIGITIGCNDCGAIAAHHRYSRSLGLWVLRSNISLRTKVTTASKASKTAAE